MKCSNRRWGEENEGDDRRGGHEEQGECEEVGAGLGGAEELKKEISDDGDGRSLPEEMSEGEQEMPGEVGQLHIVSFHFLADLRASRSRSSLRSPGVRSEVLSRW